MRRLFGFTVSWINANKEKIISAILISCALIVGVQEYTYTEKFLWVWDVEKSVNLTPMFISTLIGFCLVIPVFLRCNADILHDTSLINIILLILDVQLTATFINVLVTPENFIPGIDISGYTILLMGIILSWLGIRPIAGYIWILLIVLSLFRIIKVDHAMGYYGSIYITLCVIALLLQIRVVCGSVNGFLNSFAKDFK